MESRHTEQRVVQSFYDNKKVIYGYTVTKYITDRVRDLKSNRHDILNDLRNTTFNKHSFLLDMFRQDPKFASKFLIKHLNINALKEQGKRLYRDNGIQNLSKIDHELAKLGFFMDMFQDDVNIESEQGKAKYAGLDFRFARMFSPTMSDKSTITMLKTAVVDVTSDILDSIERKNTLLEFAYSQLVTPELERVSKHVYKGGEIKNSGVKNYDDGAKLFYFLPRLNNLTVKINNEEVSLETILETKSVAQLEDMKVTKGNRLVSIKEVIKDEVNDYIEDQQNKKLDQWQKSGFIRGTDNEYTSYSFLDERYMNKRSKSGTIDERIRVAAFDYVFNSVIINANSFMTIIGDPAQFYAPKSTTKEQNKVQIVQDTYENIGKRLANQIAPGDKIADSDKRGNTYRQLMINDAKGVSENIRMIVKVNDNKDIDENEVERIRTIVSNNNEVELGKLREQYPNSWDYMNIESTDAQEVTTWREHLYVLEKLGKSPNYTLNVTQDDINKAREIFTNKTKWESLTDKQKSIVRRVVQPMKPVYTGQIRDKQADLMRTVYIKSSSFPLIPQLTAGFEIDKLRNAMEELENHTGKTVRASYMTANKVGATDTPLDFTSDGVNYNNLNEYKVEKLLSNSIELPRSGFRLQQNVPYKSALTDEDTTTHGTQPAKLLFGNGVMHFKDFDYHGKKDGYELYKEYFNHYDGLLTQARLNLYEELGIDPVTHEIRISRKKFLGKIQKILKNEAITRGYPRQDIEALGINPDTNDFEISLWMSPNAVKYEALLTAIVSHRIAKIKFPGYSYVLGSENGFRVRTDEEFDVDTNGSQMVFTDAWNGKSLQANQAFVQSKFRVDGELINLIEDVDENGDKKWIKKIDGKWIIDTDKISPELLNIPSFRIPTSKHSTMEQIEIAGFLPENSADLMIISKDGIVKMGEDYDVDKRYTYHLWTTVENGKIIPVDKKAEYQVKGRRPLAVLESDLQEVKTEIGRLKRAASRIKNLTRQQQELIDKIDVLTGDYDMDVTEQEKLLDKVANKIEKLKSEEIDTQINYLRDKVRTLKQDKKKILQNEIIRIYSAVMSHPDVNKLMLQKLSVDDARSEAEFLESMQPEESNYFTGLSDMYQQDKLLSGVVGQHGTAAYSLDVVGQSLFEQAHNTGRTITIMQFNEQKKLVPMRLRFGNVLSDGKLGQQRTLAPSDGSNVNRSGERAIAEVHSERQNLMVDNEKEQIAPRVHLNSYTMRVDKVLNMLGFDKGDDGHGISFLFISQPIVKEYVRRMEAENSNTVEYDADRRRKIIDDLLGEFINDETDQSVWDSRMTNQKFIEQIKNNGDDAGFQAAVLKKFTMLEDYGDNLTSVQTSLNIDSKGVGKSLFEVNEKINSIQKLFTKNDDEIKEQGLIDNAGALVGNYEIVHTTAERNELLKKGYMQIKHESESNKDNGVGSSYHMIQPTTVTGTYAVNALIAADRLWNKFFPYNMSDVHYTFNEILELIGNSDLSEQKTIDTKRRIFNEMKKYLVTEQALGYFTKTPQQERRRLYMDGIKGSDNADKKSLASFLKGLIQNPEFKSLHKNRLLNRLQFDINNNGMPSLIKLDNAIGQNFDETYIYDSLIELIDENAPIGEFDGNENYTTLNLAQDLALYAYMEGGVQQAIQFVKYIPVSYLKVLGIDQIMHHRGKPAGEKNFQQRDVLGVKQADNNHISTFSYQFIQHNPELAKRVTTEIMENDEMFEAVEKTSENLDGLLSFKYTEVNKKGRHYPFVSIYNENLSKGENRFQLYVFDNKTSTYIRVPVLGVFGMSEYSAGKRGTRSLVNQRKTIFPLHDSPVSLDSTPEIEATTRRFDIKKGNIKESLELIAANENTPIGKLARFLLPVINPDTTLSVKQISDNGLFDGVNNEIIISSELLSNKNNTDSQIATTFVREVVHSITDSIVTKYAEQGLNPSDEFRITESKPEGVTDAEYRAVKKLFSLFKHAQKHLDKGGELTNLMKRGVEDGVTPKEYNVTYGGYNIREFIERMLTSPEFQQEMNKVPFGESGKSIMEKFWEWLNSTFADIAKELGLAEIDENSITANAFESIFTMIEESAKRQSDTDAEARKTIADTNKTLSDLGKPISETGFDETGGNLRDDAGNIDDDFNSIFGSKDPTIMTNFDNMNAAIAELFDKGILKRKCI